MQVLPKSKYLTPSTTPREDIAKLAYEGQPAHLKQYREGYEHFMAHMPILDNSDLQLNNNVVITNQVMKVLSDALIADEWVKEELPENTFKRTIVAIAVPEDSFFGLQEKSELVVAQWGKGYKSPVHGHATGYLYEQVLSGRIRVNTYRISNIESKVVRPYRTEIQSAGDAFVSKYAPHNEMNYYARQTLVHNFEAIGKSNSTLHYLPEHTRDGRDNGFTVEHWSAKAVLKPHEFTRVTSQEAFYSQKGEVILVRSINVPDYGDHFIVITGHAVMKPHGLRPQDWAIMASTNDTVVLDTFEPEMGLVLLKLSDKAAESFRNFHGISMEDGIIRFEEA